jgi:tRNA(fMet)-specific endonuclease VapC
VKNHLEYLLDTNVLSEPVRPLPNLNVLSKLTRYRDKVATATVVWHELLFGCQRLPTSRKRTRLEDYLSAVYPSACLRWWIRYRLIHPPLT